jgi:signal transduction histidine kinase
VFISFAERKKYSLVVIFFSLLLITYLHYSTIPEIHALHGIYAALYYIPIFLAALIFGLKGAILACLFAIAVYLPYIFMTWTDTPLFLAEKVMHIFLYVVAAALPGILIDRERKYREQSEKNRYLAGLGQATAAIVHDLKNPLVTILGFAGRISDGKGNVQEAAHAITESARDMQKIVSDVLDFAKPIKLSLKEEDIRNVIGRASACCKAKADKQGVLLSLNLPGEPFNIVIDGFRIERAIVNLINNAIDASDKSQTVTVSSTSDKDYLSVRIKDNGSGMDKETLENIFIPFYTKKQAGAGLGMAITKKMIEEHKGKIRIESQEGIGTEAIIELPYGTLNTTEVFV